MVGKKTRHPDTISTKQYHASVAGEYEPGSQDLVLKNLLGITSKEKIDEAEVKSYAEAFEYMITHISSDQRLKVANIMTIHKVVPCS